MAEPVSKSVHAIMREITNRTTQKRLELMKKDMARMTDEMGVMSLQVDDIHKTYKKLLMKDKPVGSSLKAVRHLR